MKRTDRIIGSAAVSLVLLLVPILSSAQETERIDSLSASKIVAHPASPAASLRKVERPAIDAVISPLGEADAIKYLQRLPGVSSGMEGTSSFSVRGGNSGNNNISLDGVALYGATHLFGLTSTVPAAIVSETDFCIGGFDGSDGNLIGSHIRIKSTEGAYSEIHGEASVSNIIGTAFVSAPIWKERISLTVSGRWSPAQLEYNMLAPKFAGPSTGLPSRISANVYDVYGKLSGRISEKSEIGLSYFRTTDGYAFSNTALSSRDSLGWVNDIALLNWKWRVNERLGISAAVSRNAFSSVQEQLREAYHPGTGSASLSIQSDILEYKASADADIESGNGLRLGFGAEYRNAVFRPAALNYFDAENQETGNPAIAASIAAAYLQAAYSKGRVSAKLSARVSSYSSGNAYRKFFPEGHFLLDWSFTNNLGVEFSYDHMVQFYHTLEGIPTGFSADMTVPAGIYAAPETARQFYLGVMSRAGRHFQFSAGGYYKTMDGLVFLKDADRFFNVSSTAWQDKIVAGEGTSYGLEAFIRRTEEPFTGQIAYTLSKTDRHFPDIFAGRFPAQFDRRHILNADARYSLGCGDRIRHSFSSAFTFSSGHYQTLQAGRYPAWLLPVCDELAFYTHPNNYRLPSYVRLDVSYQIDIVGKAMDQQIMLGVYNVMNRHNAFSVTWDSGAQRWKKISILPIMPCFRYRIAF